MARLSNKEKEELTFFLDDGKIKYNKTCAGCRNQCKQSFRVELVACKRYKKR